MFGPCAHPFGKQNAKPGLELDPLGLSHLCANLMESGSSPLRNRPVVERLCFLGVRGILLSNSCVRSHARKAGNERKCLKSLGAVSGEQTCAFYSENGS
jgi:hypothetical protein